jgi:hypothetical protein
MNKTNKSKISAKKKLIKNCDKGLPPPLFKRKLSKTFSLQLSQRQ